MMNRMTSYWRRPVFSAGRLNRRGYGKTKELVLAALLASLAAALQSAGGLVPGIGYLISPFATLPVAIAAFLSLKTGIGAYITAVGLLFLLQPAELVIFPFTTGLLGLTLGYALLRLRHRGLASLAGGAALFTGIAFLLTVIQFPLFGPETEVSAILLAGLGVFSFVYAWIWTEVILLFINRLSFLFP